MGLIQQAKLDIQQITSNLNDFGVEITLLNPTGETITITGLHTKHHMTYDAEGKPINGRNAHLSFSEGVLVNYTIRNSKGEVDMKGHVATINDSTETPKTYVVREWFPDETIGLIVCILGDYVNLTSNNYVVDDYVENYYI